MAVICNYLCHCEDGSCELGPGNALFKSGGSADAKILATTVYDDVLLSSPDGPVIDSRARVLMTTGVALPLFRLEVTLPDKFMSPQTEISLMPEGQDKTWKVLCQGVIRIQEGPGAAGFDYFAVYRAYPGKIREWRIQ